MTQQNGTEIVRGTEIEGYKTYELGDFRKAVEQVVAVGGIKLLSQNQQQEFYGMGTVLPNNDRVEARRMLGEKILQGKIPEDAMKWMFGDNEYYTLSQAQFLSIVLESPLTTFDNTNLYRVCKDAYERLAEYALKKKILTVDEAKKVIEQDPEHKKNIQSLKDSVNAIQKRISTFEPEKDEDRFGEVLEDIAAAELPEDIDDALQAMAIEGKYADVTRNLSRIIYLRARMNIAETQEEHDAFAAEMEQTAHREADEEGMRSHLLGLNTMLELDDRTETASITIKHLIDIGRLEDAEKNLNRVVRLLNELKAAEKAIQVLQSDVSIEMAVSLIEQRAASLYGYLQYAMRNLDAKNLENLQQTVFAYDLASDTYQYAEELESGSADVGAVSIVRTGPRTKGELRADIQKSDDAILHQWVDVRPVVDSTNWKSFFEKLFQLIETKKSDTAQLKDAPSLPLYEKIIHGKPTDITLAAIRDLATQLMAAELLEKKRPELQQRGVVYCDIAALRPVGRELEPIVQKATETYNAHHESTLGSPELEQRIAEALSTIIFFEALANLLRSRGFQKAAASIIHALESLSRKESEVSGKMYIPEVENLFRNARQNNSNGSVLLSDAFLECRERQLEKERKAEPETSKPLEQATVSMSEIFTLLRSDDEDKNKDRIIQALASIFDGTLFQSHPNNEDVNSVQDHIIAECNDFINGLKPLAQALSVKGMQQAMNDYLEAWDKKLQALDITLLAGKKSKKTRDAESKIRKFESRKHEEELELEDAEKEIASLKSLPAQESELHKRDAELSDLINELDPKKREKKIKELNDEIDKHRKSATTQTATRVDKSDTDKNQQKINEITKKIQGLMNMNKGAKKMEEKFRFDSLKAEQVLVQRKLQTIADLAQESLRGTSMDPRKKLAAEANRLRKKIQDIDKNIADQHQELAEEEQVSATQQRLASDIEQDLGRLLIRSSVIAKNYAALVETL